MRRILFALILALSGCYDGTQEQESVKVLRTAKIYTIRETDAPSRHQLFGRVVNAGTVDLGFELPGQIIAMPILEGQQLNKGTLIAQLDVSQHKLALEYAKSEEVLATQELERMNKLYIQGVVPRSQLDEATTRGQLLAIKVAQAEELIKDCSITAPFDGIVLQRLKEAHDTIVAGETVARYTSSDNIELTADVPEGLAAKITNGKILDGYARFSANPQKTWALSVLEQRAEANSTTQTYQTRFTLSETPDWNPLQGMTAKIILSLPPVSSSIEVPVGALQTDTDGDFYVWVTSGPSFMVAKRLVQVGTLKNDFIQITTGLRPGEIVIAAGGTSLQQNEQIIPLNKFTGN